MQRVLVHIDADLGPIGVWSVNRDGALQHFYPESLDPTIFARARYDMARRTTDTSIKEWFRQLAAAEPRPHMYEILDAKDRNQLSDVLIEYRRAWNHA